ncbi:MAG: FKBP-type peptidyl-prolyl cis-trans isomerase [Ilumatobacteraceae bacterium]
MRFSILIAPVAALSLLAACGDNNSSSNSSPIGTGTPTTLPGALPRPEVKLPATLPTKLVITDLTEGTGDGAAVGDTVIVHYIGERSADGTVFDATYDRGAPISATLGSGQAIKGWDQGLIGIKKGGRRQLDIPADLAYGDSPPSTDVIQPGDALTFVIDAVTIIPKTDPANAPVVSIPPTPNQTAQTLTDLIVGTGAAIEPGQTVAVQLVAFSASDGKQIDSSWNRGTPLTFIPGGGQLPPGIEKAVDGMKVGGRRQVDIPFADAFGPSGNSGIGLPPSTDLIMILDLVAVY